MTVREIMSADVARMVITGMVTQPVARPSLWRRHRAWIEPTLEFAAGVALACVVLAVCFGG